MRVKIGILLIAVGLALGVAGLLKQKDDNQVLKIGDIELTKTYTENINWMIITGGTLLMCGVLVTIIPKVK